jgi:hypothetical protein
MDRAVEALGGLGGEAWAGPAVSSSEAVSVANAASTGVRRA